MVVQPAENGCRMKVVLQDVIVSRERLEMEDEGGTLSYNNYHLTLLVLHFTFVSCFFF